MAVKLFSGAPFGTQTARFDVSAVHPQSKVPGTFTQVPYCKKSTDNLKTRLGPGTYEVDIGSFNESEVRRRSNGPGWKRAYETMRLGRIPHLLYREQWEKNRELKKKLGPGTYNTERFDFIELLNQKPSSSRGICATREQRFRLGYAENKIPGPGTYGKGGIPAAMKEEVEQKSASTVGLLDAGSSTPRNLPIMGCELAPGRYEKLSFTDQIMNKVVSKRGPYDLYTGERDKRNKTGHYATVSVGDMGPGEYNLPSFLDRWNDEHRKKHGQLGKVKSSDVPTERIYCCTLSQCPKRPDFPAPNSYTPKTPTSPGGRNLPPYLSSAERFDKRANRFFTGNMNPVGAGRYDTQKWEEAQHKYSAAHVFNSTFPRFNSQARNVYLKERIRGKDLKLRDRVHMVAPERYPINKQAIPSTA